MKWGSTASWGVVTLLVLALVFLSVPRRMDASDGAIVRPIRLPSGRDLLVISPGGSAPDFAIEFRVRYEVKRDPNEVVVSCYYSYSPFATLALNDANAAVLSLGGGEWTVVALDSRGQRIDLGTFTLR